MLPMPIESLPSTLGISLIGMGLLNILYGLTCVQAFSYFQSDNSPKDQLWIKATAASLWILNAMHVAFTMHMVYYYLIYGFGHPLAEEDTIWSLPAANLALALISTQVFYIWRIWILGKNAIACIMIACTAVGHLVSTTAASIVCLTEDTSLLDLLGGKLKIYMRLAASFGTVTEILVAFFMCWFLTRSRTGYAKTDSIINIIMAYAINCGVLAALACLGCLVANITWSTSNLSILFTLLVAPLETNGFLGSLNGRAYLQRYGENQSSQMSTNPNSNSRIAQIRVNVSKTTDAFQINTPELLVSSEFNESFRGRDSPGFRESIHFVRGSVEDFAFGALKNEPE